ncbi:MAG: D-alanine--D-alanine ligase family protein [Bacteroidota bacterium]
MNQKIRVGVIFGGRSGEHEVSLVSATSIIKALDPSKYEIVPIGITKEGKWLSSAEVLHAMRSGNAGLTLEEKLVLPDPTRKTLVNISVPAGSPDEPRLDVVFPVIHGTYGEDGTLQGLLELAGIPYVGAGVLASSVGMDKVVQKQLFQHAKIPIASFLSFLSSAYQDNQKKIIRLIEKEIGYPCFVKPANSGSSVGISKSHDRKELLHDIEYGMHYDRKIIVEYAIRNAREIECSVLGNDDPKASVPGEIVPSNEFYDYDAKYVDGKSVSIIPAKLPKAVVRKIQELAIRAFKVIDCTGMARVDFFVTKRTQKVFMNEINTIPGFTSISMYPKMWEASGISYSQLLDELIRLAIERYERRIKLYTSYQPKKDWYKE